MLDDDDWQEMPVVREGDRGGPSSLYAPSSPSSSGDEGSRPGKGARRGYSARNAYLRGPTHTVNHASLNAGVNNTHFGHVSGATNATGTHLDIDDARGYNWRARPDQAAAIEASASASQKDAKKKKKKQRRRRKKEGEESSSESSDDSSEDESNEDGAKGYTQVRLDDDVEAEDLNAATDYLFTGSAGRTKGSTALDDVDASGATPHSQLNTTKNLLTEGQKIAYVGLVSLAAKQLIRRLERVPGKDLKIAIANAEEWRLRVMARMYQHMEIEIGEQKMIESLAEHGVFVSDLAPSLITTQIVDNPDFDPEALLEREAEEERERERKEEEEKEAQEAKLKPEERSEAEAQGQDDGDMGSLDPSRHDDDAFSDFDGGDLGEVTTPRPDQTKESGWIKSPVHHSPPPPPYKENDAHAEGVDITSSIEDSAKPVNEKGTGETDGKHDEPPSTILDPNTATRIDAMDEKTEDAKLTAMGLTSQPQTINAMPSALEGVTTELSSADRTITLDLRWTVLCDLFLVLTADSVYDSRSRVLLEMVAEELGLTWMDVTKFEKRVTDALEIEESVSGSLKGKKAVRKRAQMARKRRMVMMGLATVGGGLVIGLSAGLMAPLIGAGLGAALGTIGIGGTTGFLSGVGGAAIITSTGVVGGGALGGTGMGKRMRAVQVFEFKPIHNNKRVNCIITVPGFMSGPLDDARLPFSVVDSIMGDIFSLLWEPDMMQEMGNAIYLLWNETLVQGVQQILAATIAGGLVGALAWPLWLTKLGYFIDNPWSNALDRAHSCGLILADVLSKRKMGVRPITLVGFSLGARVIFYALVELARTKKFGIVQNVYLIGAPITANDKVWREARGVVAGRFVNAYSRTDWILGWLFRATTGGLGSIAGLRPMERVPEVENVDVTQTVPGHLQYRAFMPLVLDQLGFRTTAEYFDEPEDLAAIPEREVIYDEKAKEEQDLKLKTVKTQSGGFGKIFRRKKGDGGSAASDSGTDSNAHKSDSSRRPSVYEYDDDDLPPREDAPSHAALGIGKNSSPATGSTSSLSQADETERILAELRESGIVVRELESSLPPLVAGASSYHGARRGSKLKESISLNVDDDDEEDEESQSSADKGASEKALPKINVKGSDDDEIDSRPDPGSQEASSDERASAALPVEPLSDDNRLTPSKSYAKKFGSTAFDADGLPPSAPSISPNADVSLSFGDAYTNDDFEEQQQPEKQTTADPQAAPSNSNSDSKEHEIEVSGSQYGLSAEAARELAKQFESAGMSSSGAHAAAQIAQNFEAIERADGSDDGLRPSVPLTAYNGFGVGQGGMGTRSQSGGGTSAAGYGELDPWGAVGPSSTDATPQAIDQDNERSLGASLSMRKASSASQNSAADNPWG